MFRCLRLLELDLGPLDLPAEVRPRADRSLAPVGLPETMPGAGSAQAGLSRAAPQERGLGSPFEPAQLESVQTEALPFRAPDSEGQQRVVSGREQTELVLAHYSVRRLQQKKLTLPAGSEQYGHSEGA